jgi:hypothetical protein
MISHQSTAHWSGPTKPFDELVARWQPTSPSPVFFPFVATLPLLSRWLLSFQVPVGGDLPGDCGDHLDCGAEGAQISEQQQRELVL